MRFNTIFRSFGSGLLFGPPCKSWKVPNAHVSVFGRSHVASMLLHNNVTTQYHSSKITTQCKRLYENSAMNEGSNAMRLRQTSLILQVSKN